MMKQPKSLIAFCGIVFVFALLQDHQVHGVDDLGASPADGSFVVRLHSSTESFLSAHQLQGVGNTDEETTDWVTSMYGEPVPMTSKNGKNFKCYLPPTDELRQKESKSRSSKAAHQTTIEFGRQVAKSLSKSCIAFHYNKYNFHVCPSSKIIDHSSGGVVNYQFTHDQKLPFHNFDYFIPGQGAHAEDMRQPSYTQVYGASGEFIVQYRCSRQSQHQRVVAFSDDQSERVMMILVEGKIFCRDNSKISSKVEPQNEESEQLSMPEVLKPLYDANTCIKRNEGWWTYEYCFGVHIRQYHREQNGEITSEFSLGTYNMDVNVELNSNSQAFTTEYIDGTHDAPHAAFIEEYSDGTMCDNVNKQRNTKVILFCAVRDTQHYIISMKETQTCSYVMKISTPAVCSHSHFIKYENTDKDAPQFIHCVPEQYEMRSRSSQKLDMSDDNFQDK